jgi:hypothetical protein
MVTHESDLFGSGIFTQPNLQPIQQTVYRSTVH